MLGLSEESILNHDFDIDATTNSTTLFSDDTNEKSSHGIKCMGKYAKCSVLQERLNADYGTPDTSQNYITSSSLSPVNVNVSGSGMVEYPRNYYIDQNLHSLDRNRVEDSRIVGSQAPFFCCRLMPSTKIFHHL